MAVSVLLNGSKGRMGRTIQALAPESDVQIVAALDEGDDPALFIKEVDCVIDFSVHSATVLLAELAAANAKAMVIGTTGHTEEERDRILACAERIPIVWAGNFSVGVTAMNHLVREAARILGPGYEAELVEMHHRFKADAPSGTAKELIRIILEEKEFPDGNVRNGREGATGKRPSDEVGVHAIRGGDIVGEHTVLFCGMGERIEIVHRAGDRSIFARGALRAAAWVMGRKPGRYAMEDVLGLIRASKAS